MAAMIPVGGAGIGMHVIPIESSISSGTKTASYEQLSYWLKKYNCFALSDCACRRTRRMMGEGCGHSEKDICNCCRCSCFSLRNSQYSTPPTYLSRSNFVARVDNAVPTETAPCKVNCPAHIAVQGYIKLAALGKYREALELIRMENPLPAVCGGICNRRCEFECTRGDIDQLLAIDVARTAVRSDVSGVDIHIRKGDSVISRYLEKGIDFGCG